MKQKFGKRHGKVAFFAAMAVSVFAMMTGAALADSTQSDSSATLNGGNLSLTQSLAAGTFAGSLNGAPQTLAADGNAGSTTFSGFQAQDARGLGTGWNVTVSASRFVNGDGSGHDFALASLTMPQLAVAGLENSSEAPGMLNGPAAIDNSDDGISGGVVMAATNADGQGMGTYDFSAADPWTLAVPAAAYAGIYHSTVTTTLAPLTF
jgi:hypothetical protein